MNKSIVQFSLILSKIPKTNNFEHLLRERVKISLFALINQYIQVYNLQNCYLKIIYNLGFTLFQKIKCYEFVNSLFAFNEFVIRELLCENLIK